MWKTIKQLISFLFKYGFKYKTNSGTILLSLYGSTIGATIINNRYKILTRPYPPCKPGNKGWRVLQLNWLVEFVRGIEQITIKYFEIIYPNKKSKNNSIFDK